MLHTNIGNIGHFAVVLAFVSAIVSAYGYFRASQPNDLLEQNSWKKFARIAFFVHSAAVLSIVVCLYGIIRNHYFEYHYAWSHSSKSLPTYYMVSCFWEGQEGSFLLWIFWHCVLGIALIFYKKSQSWESPVLAIFAAVQAFLVSMILGVVIFDVKIGSSPFLLMREALPDLPVWQSNPNFIPADGNGLNPLLQNYWMVIHPPTLFLGFALTIVPFAFAIAGLWQKQYTAWLKPALPWTHLAGAVLGVGIIMGAIWAYETLTFGGYWSWDPVENAVYVPWLVLVAGLHSMILYKGSSSALKVAIILVISQFVLILYSTFLTRSGILGNASVHSFTDLGLSGQLLVYLLFFVAVSVFVCIKHWKHLPTDTKEATVYSREFWLFTGATVLCLAAFQIIFTTSIPVYNKVAEAFGFVLNIAMPTNQIKFFTDIQVWFFIVIAILSGIGQYVWWAIAKPNKDFWKTFLTPILLALFLTLVIVNFGIEGKLTFVYILVLFAAFFSLVTNLNVIISILKGKVLLSGGAITHTGVALMLIGILFSAGYSKVVTQNRTGKLIFDGDTTQENLENQVLWLNKPEKLDKYSVTYKGNRIEARDLKTYLSLSQVEPIEGDFRAVALEDISENGTVRYKRGDTLEIFPENNYYEIEYREPDGKIFSLYPRIQKNPKMGNAASPALLHQWKRDIYSHVTYAELGERDWSAVQKYSAQMGDTLFLNDYVAVLENVVRVDSIDNIRLSQGDAAVKAVFRVFDRDRAVELNPSYVIKDGMVRRKPIVNEELGLRVAFDAIDPRTGTFSFGVETTQKDFIVLKAYEKPFINLLWIGTVILAIGFIISTFRRFGELKR
jgi:cytochrome c-type biogenesis protein CcmF